MCKFLRCVLAVLLLLPLLGCSASSRYVSAPADAEGALVCPSCKGTGLESDKRCDSCNGTGRWMNTGHMERSTVASTGRCTRCEGSGKLPGTDPCNLCKGTAKVHRCDADGNPIIPADY